MIGPDLVRVRKKNGALLLAQAIPEAALRARALAEQVLLVLSGAVNETRSVVEEALYELESTPQEKKLLSALRKLALDDSVFDGNAALDAPSLRREVFARAALARQDLAIGAHFDRDRVCPRPRPRSVSRPSSSRRGCTPICAAPSGCSKLRRTMRMACWLVTRAPRCKRCFCARCASWSMCCARLPISTARCFRS